MKSLSKLSLALALACAFGGAAQAGLVISFDELGQPGRTVGGQQNFVSQGFKFSANMDVIDVSPTGGSWSTGTGSGHSGKYATLNDWGGDMVMTKVGGGTFTVDSLWANGWQGHSQTANVTGYLNGNAVQSFTGSFGQPWTQLSLNFSNIDQLRFSTGSIFLIDDISVDGGTGRPLPEPASWALVGAALLGLGVARKRVQK